MMGAILVLTLVTAWVSWLIWMANGRVPRWFFRTFMAWWWPFRRESPATIVCTASAAMIDADLTKQWLRDNRGLWASESLKAWIESKSQGRYKFWFEGHQTVVSAWDDHRIDALYHRLESLRQRQQRVEQRQQCNEQLRRAATTARETLVEIKNRQLTYRPNRVVDNWDEELRLTRSK
jgi:hypothetical protein